MLAAIAKEDITPAIGTDMTGYIARTGPAEGVHDPLYCRALVLESEGEQTALVVCDCLGFGLEYTREVKAKIEMATGIPAANVILAATHTHAGPASVFLQNCGELALDWLRRLPERLVAVTRKAQASLAPARAAMATARVPGVALNRRDPQGGSLDDELTVVKLTGEEGKLLGSMLHFSCHAVVLDADNRLISADYPGLACSLLEEATGTPCLFLQGPCGDINPVMRGSFTAVEETGAKLAEAAKVLIDDEAAWMDLEANSVLINSQRVALPLAEGMSFEQLLAFREEQEAGKGEVESQFREVNSRVRDAMRHWAERTLASYCSGLLQDDVKVELQSLSLGDLLLFTTPGELFVEFGLEAKRLAMAAGKRALLLAYANGDIGYIPTRASYEKGGYEVEWAYKYYGYPAALAPEAGEMIKAKFKEAI